MASAEGSRIVRGDERPGQRVGKRRNCVSNENAPERLRLTLLWLVGHPSVRQYEAAESDTGEKRENRE